MGRPFEVNGQTFYEPKLRWKAGRAYMRCYDPALAPARKDYPLHTSDPGTAQMLFQQRRFEYLHGILDPWERRRGRAGTTLHEAVEKYLAVQDVKASTLKSKRTRLEPFARANPGMLISGVTVDAVKAYCYNKKLKRSTQQRYLFEVRHFLDYCREQGWTSSNPAEELRKATPRRKKRQAREITEYLSTEEVRRIIRAIEYDMEQKPRRRGRAVLVEVILFAVLTGLRVGEICHLKWRDVRLFDPPKKSRGGARQYGWISVRDTKTGDEDRVPVVAQCAALLGRLPRGKSGYVFESPRNRERLSDWWVSNRFREYRRMAKIREEIHFHSLRHTCASWLAEQGVDLKVIQEVMRHGNLKQTERYAHLIPEVVASKMTGAFDRISIEHEH